MSTVETRPRVLVRPAPSVVGEPAPRRTGPRRQRGARATGTAARRPGPPVLARSPAARATRPPRARATVRRARRGLRAWRLPARFWAWAWFLLLGGLSLALAWHPAWRVQRIEVQGLRWSDPAALTALPALQAWQGVPVVAVDAREVEAVVQAAFPLLEGVHAQVRWPDALLLTAREREPVLVWQSGRQSWWVDAQGVAFPALGEADPAWPVVRALNPSGRGPSEPPGPEQVRLALALHQALGPQVALVAHPTYGLGWRAPQGWLVFVGFDPNGLDTRLAVYEALAAALQQREEYPVWIDLRAWQTPGLHFDEVR